MCAIHIKEGSYIFFTGQTGHEITENNSKSKVFLKK